MAGSPILHAEPEGGCRSEVGGGDRSGTESPLPGNRFRFRVRAVRAGEAKLRACGRGEAAWAGEKNDPAVARAFQPK